MEIYNLVMIMRLIIKVRSYPNTKVPTKSLYIWYFFPNSHYQIVYLHFYVIQLVLTNCLIFKNRNEFFNIVSQIFYLV